MFCSNCGKKLEDGMKHCPHCGAEIKEVSTSETGGIPGKKKGKNRAALLAAAAVVLAAVVFLAGRLFFGGMTLNAVDYISFHVDGLNTEGKANISFDTQKLLQDISAKKTLTEREKEVIAVLVSDADKDFALSKSSGLSNGDEIRAESSMDKKLLKDYGVTLNNGTVDFTVENLVEIREIALTDYVVFSYYGFDGKGTCDAWLDWEKLREAAEEQIRGADSSSSAETFISGGLSEYFSGISVTPYFVEQLSNGDEVEVTVAADNKEISKYGVRFTDGTVSSKAEGLAVTEKILLADYLTCEFEGYNGNGNASIRLDEERLTKDLQEIFNRDQRGAYGILTDEMNPEEQAADAVDVIQREWDYYFGIEMSSDTGLSNGDSFRFDCVSESEEVYLSSIGCYLEGGSMETTVEGLVPTETVDLTEYLKCEFSGYDGAGSVTVTLDTESLTTNLQAAFENDERGAWLTETETGENVDYAMEAASAAKEISSEWRSYFTLEISRQESLSNDDIITLDCTASEEMIYLSYIGCYLKGGSAKTTVEGLEEPQEVDLAEALSVQFSGVCPLVKVEREVQNDLPYYYETNLYDFYYDERIIAENGDLYEGEILYDEEEMLNNGYRVINNRFSYPISGLNSYHLSCTSLQEELLMPMESEMMEHARSYMAESYEDILEAADVRNGWIVWDQVKIALDSGKFAYFQTENDAGNCLFLVYRGLFPIRKGDRSATEKEVYYVVSGFNVQETADHQLIYDNWKKNLYMDPGSAEEAIQAVIQEMGEGVVLTELPAEETSEMSEAEADPALAEITVSAEPEEELLTGEISGNAANLAASVISCQGHIYARYDTAMNWDLAKQFCETAGGHLATVTSQKENSIINKLLEDAPLGSYWLGATDQDWEGGWNWITGETFDWNDWGSSQPDNDTGNEEEQENYLETGRNHGNHWNDNFGSRSDVGFILEVEPENITKWLETSEELSEQTPSSVNNAGVKEYVQDTYGKDHFYSVYLDASENGTITYNLEGKWDKLSGTLSTWAEAQSEAAFDITIWGDDKILFSRYDYHKTDAPVPFCLDVAGVKKLSVVSCNRGAYSDGFLFIHEPILYQTELLKKQEETKKETLSELQNVDSNAWEARTDQGAQIDYAGEIHRDWNRFETDPSGGGQWYLNGKYTEFTGCFAVSPQASVKETSVGVEILADGESLFREEHMDIYKGKVPFCVDLTGKQLLEIRVWRNSENVSPKVYLYDTALDKTEEQVLEKTSEKTQFPGISANIGNQAAAVITCGNFRYYRFDQAVTWQEAAVFCKSAGGNLACPDSSEKNAAVQNLISGGLWKEYWLGGLKNGSLWKWLNGENVTGYENWSSGQPDNYGEKEYLLSMYQNGTWNDLPDEDKTGFVMEVEAVSGQKTEETGLSELEWENSTSSEICDTIDEERNLHIGSIEMNASNEAFFTVSLNGNYTLLSGKASCYRNASNNVNMQMAVFGDGKCLFTLDNLKKASDDAEFTVDVTGIKKLTVRTRNTGSYDGGYLYLTDTQLTPSEDLIQVRTARLADLVSVDMAAASAEDRFFQDAYGFFHDGSLRLNAGDGAFAMYHLEGAYTVFTGTITASTENTNRNSTVRITFYADGEELQTIDFEKASGPAAFELDLTGKQVLEMKADIPEEGQNTAVYLTDDQLQ